MPPFADANVNPNLENALWVYAGCSIVIGIPLYFLPTIIAVNRSHRNTTAIFLLNLFLGWALVGWVLGLVWAVWADEGKRKYYSGRRSPEPDYDPFAPTAPPPPPAGMAFSCPHCRRLTTVPSQYFGSIVTCAGCMNAFTATVPPPIV